MDTYIASSSVAGNGLFAGRDFVAGEAVFSTSRPLVAALDNKRLSDTCANCFVWTAKSDIGDLGSDKGRDGVKACLGCRTLSYCSKVRDVTPWKKDIGLLEETFKVADDVLLFRALNLPYGINRIWKLLRMSWPL